MIRRATFFLFMLFCTSGISANDLDTNDQIRYQSLIQEVRCLVCQNQSVAESNAELAKDLRREIKLQIQDGKSDTEIKRYLLDRYGEFILYEPAFTQKTLFLWFSPVILLLMFYGWFRKIGN
ncbi:MAG: cytochrome c-type biogenesis protein [Pseudomonadota bacterium]|nr:cytochrome c-type biogenesis protein [Pseudomonadota bacterium]